MQQAILEVERKFCVLAIPLLLSNAGTPPFRKLRFLGEQTSKDVYFDSRDSLSANGIWDRKRQVDGEEAIWEAKTRKDGTFNNLAFEERTDAAAIAQHVDAITGRHEPAAGNFGSRMLAALGTRRKSWLADEHDKILLDCIDFGHEASEVELELERTVMLPRDNHHSARLQAMKCDITRDVDRQIEAFMKRYRWALGSGIPRGKLTAYFEKQRDGCP